MKVAKHLLMKTGPTDFPAALAAWRNTARPSKPSPNELMFGRKIRDMKAVASSHLTEKIHVMENMTASHEDHELRQQDIERNQPSTETFMIGDSVRVQNPSSNKWDTSAIISNISNTGRTLDLLTSDGRALRRNRRFVR